MRHGQALMKAMAVVMVLGGTAPAAEPVMEDSYLWLEDIHGAKALDWVKAENAVALKTLKADPDYQNDYDTLLAILDADDRLPLGSLHGDMVLNFWQDKAQVRGIWRRTTIASYDTGKPVWETLLDVDKLAADEGKSWVFKEAHCSSDFTRCLIALSLGGGDAVEWREFDPARKRFIEDGFHLTQAKADAQYIDTDTILFGTDFGPGTMTTSGYPRIVKLWRRGQPLADAEIVLEGRPEDVEVSPLAFPGPGGTIALVARGLSFFETEYFYVQPDGSAVKLPLPLGADVRGATTGGITGADSDQLIITLRKDWTPAGQATIPAGSLIAFGLRRFLATGGMPLVSVLYTPSARSSVGRVAVGRDAVYAAISENVIGTIHTFRRDQDHGAWTDTTLALPKGGATGIASANPLGSEAYLTYQSFLQPLTLFADHRAYGGATGTAPQAIKAEPARFDAAPYAMTQYEATSKDGTKIPYFVVRAKDASGPVPTMLYGYGGFEISLTPFYWVNAGKLWLAKGGAYAVANIRGGGEFGPGWHDAALKTNRQKAYDDFIAVAEDMIARGLSTPRQLGIMGGSNGGLLVGAVMVERPDLFGAVVCQVPLLDMIRFVKIGAGASWIGEYGDPAKAEERAAILKYSPYQNVKRGVAYPPVFFVTATSDDRVTPVHARKMAARMHEQGHDVLFYENTEGGHAAAANHAQAAEMNALTYVFLKQKLGLQR